MPTPDYDRINSVCRSILDDAARHLFHYLLLAIRDGSLPSVDVCWHWAICERCEGSGGTSSHFGLVSRHDISEWSDDFRAAYFAGDFDERCVLCEGSGKVQVVDEKHLLPEHLDFIAEYRRQAFVSANEYRYEALAGC